MNNNIVEFIDKRFKDSDWSNGNCYWLAYILSQVFKECKICYLPVTGHFIVKDSNNNYYDQNGLINVNEVIFELDEIKEKDPIWYKRLERDCIL